MGMKLWRHVDRKKIGGEGRNDNGRIERSKGGEEGGLYTREGAPHGIGRHVRSALASMPAMSVRVRNGNFRLARTAEDTRRTLTPPQFAPDSDNKRLATFG